MAQSRIFLLIFGGIFCLMSALQIVRFLHQPSDIWWTPKMLAVPLAETSDRVQVYVRDLALLEQAKAGRIQLLTDSGANPVTESDVRLRLLVIWGKYDPSFQVSESAGYRRDVRCPSSCP